MISRWEKAAKKMVKIDAPCGMEQGPSWVGDWRVEFPSCAAPDGITYAYFGTRGEARRAAQRRIRSLTKILQRASKAAGF